jgi:hypothetical protein
LDEVRRRGDLAENSFVVIPKTLDANRRIRFVVANPGEADALLRNRDHFRSRAKKLPQCGVVPFDDERWDGWLGKYNETLREAWLDLEQPCDGDRNAAPHADFVTEFTAINAI